MPEEIQAEESQVPLGELYIAADGGSADKSVLEPPPSKKVIPIPSIEEIGVHFDKIKLAIHAANSRGKRGIDRPARPGREALKVLNYAQELYHRHDKMGL